jgi:hypothetical protein
VGDKDKLAAGELTTVNELAIGETVKDKIAELLLKPKAEDVGSVKLTAEILLALGMLEVFEEMIYFEDQDDVKDSTDDVGLELQTQISPLTTSTTMFDVTPTTSQNAAVLPPMSSQLYASGDNISHISTSTKNNGTQTYYFSRWDLQEADPHLPGCAHTLGTSDAN